MEIKFSELRPGMIGLSGGGAFMQRQIKWWTGSEYSHGFSVGKGVNGVLSAFETTSTITSLAPMEAKRSEPDYIEIWDPILATEEERDRAFEAVWRRHSHRRYGYESYLWFMWRAGAKKFGYEPKRIWNWAAGGITCTELTCDYIDELNAQYEIVFRDLDLNTQSPQELRCIMSQHPTLFVLRGTLVWD